jgi:serine protease Do
MEIQKNETENENQNCGNTEECTKKENSRDRGKHSLVIIISVVLSLVFGSAAGFLGGSAYNSYLAGSVKINNSRDVVIPDSKVKVIQEESGIIEAVNKVNPAVVSIIVTKDLPKIERYYINPFGDDFFDDFFGSPFSFGIPQERQNGTEKKEIGGGTGFIVSSDGIIVTNKHVVEDKDAEYTVLMNNEKRYQAKVLARDPSNDIAILKIEEKNLPVSGVGRFKCFASWPSCNRYWKCFRGI